MSKQWTIVRSDLKHEATIGKLYSEIKFQELNKLFDYVSTKFDDDENLKTALRGTVEEVTNIIQSNKSWHEDTLTVRSEMNANTRLVKIHIFYKGDEYYDPELNKITTVIGSISEFQKYERQNKIENGFTHIRITIQLHPLKSV